MGFLQGLAGNMSQIEPGRAQELYGPWLLEGEQIQSAFAMMRDGFCITSFRIITIDRQGATGKKTRVMSIPLNAIVDVTAETAGGGIDDSEITISFISSPRLRAHSVSYGSYRFEFPKSFDIAALYRFFMGIAQQNLAYLNQA